MKTCSKCLIEKDISFFPEKGKRCIQCHKDYKKNYRDQNKEKCRTSRNNWAIRNRDKDRLYKKKYRDNNKDKERAYRRNRWKNDNDYRIRQGLRHRIWMALEGYAKSKSTLKLLGCSLEEFKKHLESKFQPGMSWENYGYRGWHIDHIKPCAAFDLTKSEEQEQCFCYKNMQPLWGIDNIAKSDKILSEI